MFKLFRIGTIQNVRNRIWGILLLFRWILLFLWYLHSLVIDVSAWLNFSLWPLTSNAWIITVISWCHAWWELKYLNKLTILHCKSDPPSHQPPKPILHAHIVLGVPFAAHYHIVYWEHGVGRLEKVFFLLFCFICDWYQSAIDVMFTQKLFHWPPN